MTGVQTCALPIWLVLLRLVFVDVDSLLATVLTVVVAVSASPEVRVEVVESRDCDWFGVSVESVEEEPIEGGTGGGGGICLTGDGRKLFKKPQQCGV